MAKPSPKHATLDNPAKKDRSRAVPEQTVTFLAQSLADLTADVRRMHNKLEVAQAHIGLLRTQVGGLQQQIDKRLPTSAPVTWTGAVGRLFGRH